MPAGVELAAPLLPGAGPSLDFGALESGIESKFDGVSGKGGTVEGDVPVPVPDGYVGDTDGYEGAGYVGAADGNDPVPDWYDGTTLGVTTLADTPDSIGTPETTPGSQQPALLVVVRLKTRLDTRPKKPHGLNSPLPQPPPQLLNGPD